MIPPIPHMLEDEIKTRKLYLSRYIDETHMTGILQLMPMAEEIEKNLKETSDDELRKIVKNYETELTNLKGLKKLKRYFNPIKSENKEKYLKYLYARDKLLGYIDRWYDEIKTKENEEQHKHEEKKKLEELLKKSQQIEIFFGSIENYREMKNDWSYKIIDMKRQKNYVEINLVDYNTFDTFHKEQRMTLVKIGIEAIVNAQAVREPYIANPDLAIRCLYLGTPVGRKAKN